MGIVEFLNFKVQDKSVVDPAFVDWRQNNPGNPIQELVNNAGITKDGLFMWVPKSNWDDVIAISLKCMLMLDKT